MSQVKTGAPPNFKAQTDLSNLIPSMAASVGIGNIVEAIEFYKKNRGAIQALIRFFKGLFGGGKPAPAAASTPVPSPVSPAPVTVGPDMPERGPAAQRTPTSLKASLMLVEKKNNPRKAGGGRYIADRDTFAAIKALEDPARRGDRLHMNVTPADAFGDFQPGGRENRGLLYDPESGPEGRSRIEHIITGGGELTSEYDDHGCTPVILIPWEQESGPFPIDTGKRWEVTYQAVWRGDGVTFKSDLVRVIVEE